MSAASPRLVLKEDCGCRHYIDARGREIIEQCSSHKELSDARHQAARESGSHVYGELVSA